MLRMVRIGPRRGPSVILPLRFMNLRARLWIFMALGTGADLFTLLQTILDGAVDVLPVGLMIAGDVDDGPVGHPCNGRRHRCRVGHPVDVPDFEWPEVFILDNASTA